MTKFFHATAKTKTPLHQPEDARQYLAKPKIQWKTGKSAKELAESWIRAQNFPASVRSVLDTCPDYHDAELIEGFFERKTHLRSPGRDSQTDLLVFARTATGVKVIGVEGKRDEPFADLVNVWNKTAGQQTRLEVLCSYLELDPADCGDLRYQLFHRTVATLFEAETAQAREALMLVHSFSPDDTSFDDFHAFTAALDMPVETTNTIGPARTVNGIVLRFGWVRDPRAL